MYSLSYTKFDKKRGEEQFPFQTETSVLHSTKYYGTVEPRYDGVGRKNTAKNEI